MAVWTSEQSAAVVTEAPRLLQPDPAATIEVAPTSRTVCHFRLLVWTAATAVGLLAYRFESPWVWRIAGTAYLYFALSSWLTRRKERSRTQRAIDMGVELIGSTLVIALGGGFAGPFGVLLPVAVASAYCDLGPRAAFTAAAGAVALGLGTLAVNSSLRGTVLYVGTSAVVLGSGWLLRNRREESPEPDTLMAPRTADELEARLDSLGEEHRQLRSRFRETTSAARDQRARIDEMAVGRDLMAASVEAADSEAGFVRLLALLMERFDASAAAIWLLDAKGAGLEVAGMHGNVAPQLRDHRIAFDREKQPSEIRVAAERALAARCSSVATVSLAVIVNSAANVDVKDADGPATVGFALRGSSGIFGAVAIGGPRRGRFASSDPAKAVAVSANAALAVQNVLAKARLSHELREAALLQELMELAQSAPSLERLTARVAELIARVSGAENVSLYLAQEPDGMLAQRATVGRSINLLDHLSFPKGTGICGMAVKERKPIFFGDVLHEPMLMGAELVPPQVRTFLCAPMLARGRAVGAVNVSHASAHAFSQEVVRLVTVLASQAALALERGAEREALEHLAITDGLTGLYNHRYYARRLDNEAKRSARYGSHLVLILLDLDRFKAINDSYGHGAGNGVLADVAALIRRSVREPDIVARVGGDELAVIMPQTSISDAMLAAERLRVQVEREPFQTPDGAAVHLTLSLGVAEFHGAGDASAQLQERADAALYAAKEAGRNCVRVAGDPVRAV